ncbi:hypothetical protein [Arthrobacter sp. B3I4]|uniref:hypothetical protein n=1 Tax=Arthrobacter sp. B3I4 TaxID=3042267 RepID=UPI002780BE11|nr:hypothetical protein [Arthrobacter sp. B3I4]MDQ0756601.1 hypothetical protein [Arthrobacter sp. B3I4]
MNIRDHWDRLDPATRKWLMDNPGCQILPRTLTTVVTRETGEDLTDSQHGEKVLSPEDHEFIRAKANEGSTA